jgi:proteasome lid subunit RPN8/RPN11
MMRGLRDYLGRWFHSLSRMLDEENPLTPVLLPAATTKTFGRIERVRLTDQVCRTIFDDFAKHRRGKRGEEEIGWVLLGVREETSALVLATLPAGANREAGVAHVRFNSGAQALASRIVRQWDKRLTLVGVVHTHPGSLRHPSDGDFRGDSQWVGQLRGGEGIFGIGTADVVGPAGESTEPHRQILNDLCFSWYALGQGDNRYLKLPVEVVLGSDLAKPLHFVWEIIEKFAEPLDCLCRQMARVTFEVTPQGECNALAAKVSMPEKDDFLKIVLEHDETRYFVQHDGMLNAVDPEEENLERAVYLILAELANLRKKAPVSA